MRHTLRLNGQDHTAALIGPASNRQVWLDDTILTASLTHTAGSAATLTVQNQTIRLHIIADGDRVFIHLNGEVYEVAVIEPLALHASHALGASALQTHAPMPGSVVAIPVAIGDMVHPGDTLVIIESMKLEVSLKATQAGQVGVINCTVGSTFDKDAVLITLVGEGHS